MPQFCLYKNGKYTIILTFSLGISPVNTCFVNKIYSSFVNCLKEEEIIDKMNSCHG